MLPTKASLQGCSRLQKLGSAIDELLVASKGIILKEAWRYKGRMSFPRFVNRKLIQKGSPVANNPWSLKVVRWSAISARLTEISKELEHQASQNDGGDVEKDDELQPRLPAVLRQWIWHQVD